MFLKVRIELKMSYFKVKIVIVFMCLRICRKEYLLNSILREKNCF